MVQFALFTEAPIRSTTPTPEMVRERIFAVLAELEQAETMPWTAAETQRWEVLVPQMCRWLPAREAAEISNRFSREVSRLTARQAA